MSSYVDLLLTNNQFIADSSEENIGKYNSVLVKQKGGDPNNKADVLKNTATGSFPPIYIMTKIDIKKEEEQEKIRSYAKKSTAVSIREIMQKRREDDEKPFIQL